MEITKEKAQSLRMKMPNAELYLKEAGHLPLLPACSKIARTSVKVGKTTLHPLVQLREQEQAFDQLITRRMSDDTELLRFNFLR